MKDNKNQNGKLEGKENKKVKQILFDGHSLRNAIILVAFAILFYWGVNHTDKPIALINGFISVLSPFIIGLALAFVMNVLMNPLERLWQYIWRKSKTQRHLKFKRPVCLVLSTLIFLGIISAVLFMIIPEFTHTAESFIKNIPQYVTQVGGWWARLTVFAERFGLTLPEFSLDAKVFVDKIGLILKDNDSFIFSKTLDITTSIFSIVFNVVLAFVFSIYILAQKEKLGKQCKNILYAFFKDKKVDKFLGFLRLTNQTFVNFMTGQFTEAVIIGVLCFIGMTIFGMPYATIISVLVGFTALIPIFGALIGTSIGAFLILLVSPVKAFWFVVFIIVLQQLEGNLIYPKVVGKSVGLPGIWVLAAVTVGNNLWGIVGMLISVPCCAVLYTLLQETVRARLSKKRAKAKSTEPSKE